MWSGILWFSIASFELANEVGLLFVFCGGFWPFVFSKNIFGKILYAFLNWVYHWILLVGDIILLVRKQSLTDVKDFDQSHSWWVLLPRLSDCDLSALSNNTVLPTEDSLKDHHSPLLGASTSRRGEIQSLYWEINWDQKWQASESQTEECGYYGFQDRRDTLIWKLPFPRCQLFPVPLTILHRF